MSFNLGMMMGGRGSFIKSVHPFEITIPTGATSATETIVAVNKALSAVFFNGFTTSNNGTAQQEFLARAELTDSTTITAYRDASSASQTATVRGYVVEFSPSLVESVQHDVVAIASSASSGTQTISSVDTSRSAVFLLGRTNTTSTTSVANTNAAIDLTDATTVTATRAAAATAALTIGFCVVQFKAAVIKSIQQRSVTLTSATTGDADTLTAVDPQNTILMYNGAYCSSTTLANFCYNLILSNGTTTTLTRTGTATTSRTIKYTAIEFNPGVITSMQRNTTAIASVTSADTAIAEVSLNNAICNQQNFSQTSATPSQLFATAKLEDSVTVRGEKDVAGAATSTPAWEVFTM